MHYFPGTALTNDHKLGGLKKQKSVLSQKIPEIFSQRVDRAVLPLEVLEVNMFLASSDGHWHPLACGCVTLISASVVTSSSLCVVKCPSVSLAIGFRTRWDNPG